MAKVTRQALAVICACVGSGGATTVSASEAPPPRPMPVGAPARPPAGFLELCSREPQICVSGEAADADKLASIRSRALTQYWSSIFPSVGAPAASGRAPHQAENHLSGAGDARTPPPEELPGAFSWSGVERLNRAVNSRIKHASDERSYGVSDYWTVPTGAFPRGDCEDYVLAKRTALIEIGVPAEQLSIALVDTRWGESHAVLLLSTHKGEYVLDNLTPRVLHWTEADYVWRERQLPGQPLVWAQVDRPRA